MEQIRKKKKRSLANMVTTCQLTMQLTHFRDIKSVSQTSSVVTVIVTENWILKATPYCLRIAHQSDAKLIAAKVIAD